MTSQTLCNNSQQETNPLKIKYGNLTNFLETFNPGMQREVCYNENDCFFGTHPTCGAIKRAFGSEAAVMWLTPQLYDLSEFCGCKDKLSIRQLEECAFLISNEYHYLKISELMLFFARFKAGRYGKFYGAVDPMTIMCELRTFINERSQAISTYEQEQREKKEREEKKKAITWEEYCMQTYGEVKPHPFFRKLKN